MESAVPQQEVPELYEHEAARIDPRSLGYWLEKPDDPGRIVVRKRYYNANYMAVAIVAVCNEAVGDFAAYIGGAPAYDVVERPGEVVQRVMPAVDYTYKESDLVLWVARHGVKITEPDARHYFADLFEGGWRWRP